MSIPKIKGQAVFSMLGDNKRFVLILFILGFCVYVQFINGNAGDKEGLLNMAAMWLSKKTFYDGIFSALLPMIIWIYAIPVALAKVMPISEAQLLAFLGLAVVMVSVGTSINLIKNATIFAREDRIRVEFATLLSFMFVVWSNALYFFDREHIFLVLTFPYMLRWMPSLAGQALPVHTRVLVGVMAAVGFCLKPHCIIAFAAVQLLTVYHTRSWRIVWSLENVIICGLGVFYLVTIAIIAPEYYTIVLPMTLATYSAASDTKASVFYGALALILFAVTFIDFRLRDRSPYRQDIFYFLGICAALLLYALSNNGWGYTWNPLYNIILLVTGFVYWEHKYLAQQAQNDGHDQRRFRFGMRACFINFSGNTAAVLVLYGLVFSADCDVSCKIDKDLATIVKQSDSKTFGHISINFTRWASLARDSGARQETRFLHLWMLPKFFITDMGFRQKHQWILDYVSQAYADDMNNNKPDLMFVDDTDMFYRIYYPVNLVEFLSANESFRAAWTYYRFRESVNHCVLKKKTDQQVASALIKQNCKYDVYQRITNAVTD